MLLNTLLFLSLIASTISLPTQYDSRAGKSVSKLSLSRRINIPSGKTIPQVDQDRLKALKASVAPKPKGNGSVFSDTISNGAVIYTADVSFMVSYSHF